MNTKNNLNEFFAVTLTSIYEVKSDDGNGYPVAKKIVLKGDSAIPVGGCLKNGTMIAICNCLIAYIPEKYGFGHQLTGFERRIEMVNARYWGGLTSPIVALFKTEKEAIVCLEETDLKSCDPRWVEQTKEVLVAIGDDHPVFEVCRSETLALLCAI